jgi:hypothetical protein
MPSKLSIVDKILISALEVENSGKARFSAEDLVVSAWKNFPNAFGLQGHLDDEGRPVYPNSNRVYAEIMGSKPLRKQGLLQKVGNKMYKLTETGRNRARLLADVPKHKIPDKWSLAREKIEQVRRLHESKAARKVRSGNFNEISFFDACGFWGIRPRSSAKDLYSRFIHIENVLDEAIKAFGSRNMASSIHGRVPYTVDDIESLYHVHQILKEKFSEDIEFIKKRFDERKI